MIERYSRPQMKQVWSDENKFQKWLNVELAVCEAWAEVGAIPKEAIPKLKQARVDMKRINEILKVTHHDMTAFVNSLAETLDEESRFIHLGLTSSDVMDTALSLQILEATDLMMQDIDILLQILKDKALEHKDTLMMGRTHGVHAEPITFGLKLALWYLEMERNKRRLEEARKVISVGKLSGAVGTHATVPLKVEEIACTILGLSVAQISSQIIQRDRHAQYLTTLTLVACSLEKFATEIRGLQRTEVLEAEEPFEPGQTGSSAMPHKRNPELCERICGLARLMRGYSLTSMENVALWHERDISHSSTERIILPDGCLVLDYILDKFNYIMKGLRVHPENMLRNLEITQGLIFSQRVMLTLIEKGMSRQQAYAIVQRNSMTAWREKKSFLHLLENDPELMGEISRDELRGLFDYKFFTKYVDDSFRRMGWLS